MSSEEALRIIEHKLMLVPLVAPVIAPAVRLFRKRVCQPHATASPMTEFIAVISDASRPQGRCALPEPSDIILT